jgi:hypothetical protein
VVILDRRLSLPKTPNAAKAWSFSASNKEVTTIPIVPGSIAPRYLAEISNLLTIPARAIDETGTTHWPRTSCS